MLNKVMLIGRLCADPETRFTTSGVQTSNFRLAVDRKFKSSTGELKQDTLFVKVVTWGKVAKKVSDYLGKGSLVYVEGRLQIRAADINGQKTWFTEVIANSVMFLDKKAPLDSTKQSETTEEEYEFVPEEIEEIS
jgi:single-strand DNA-binding protein